VQTRETRERRADGARALRSTLASCLMLERERERERGRGVVVVVVMVVVERQAARCSRLDLVAVLDVAMRSSICPSGRSPDSGRCRGRKRGGAAADAP
jgi:hypothetical protein